MTMISSSTLEEKLAGKPCDSGSVEDATPDAADPPPSPESGGWIPRRYSDEGDELQKGLLSAAGRKSLALQNGALLRGLSVASGSLIIASAIIQTNTSKPVEDPWLKFLLLASSIFLGYFSGMITWSKVKDRQ